MSTYTPLHIHSHYSLLLGLSQPKDIAARCLGLGISSCALTDVMSISGCVSFYKEMISHKIKPIFGCELYISNMDPSIKNDTNDKLSKVVVLCKNIKGWNALISIVSKCNSREYYHNKPRIDYNNLKSLILSQDLICITGFYDSCLWNRICSDNLLNHDWEAQAISHLTELQNIFGEDNVFVEIQLFDNLNNKKSVGSSLRDFCIKHNYQRVAGIDSYYCLPEDSVDQHILLCSNLKTTLPEVSRKIIDQVDIGFNHFFNSNQYHILSNETMIDLYDEVELSNTILIDSMCEAFSPLNKPILPSFSFPPEFSSEVEYLRQLCRDGWTQKIVNIIPKEDQIIYVDRIKQELDILAGAGLSSYFLIVRDILRFIRENEWLPGPGRGSAAGCLVSYLIGITSIDPIKYGLLFERFYNAGRNTKDRISMPDIDIDVPIHHREAIITYIKNKYGIERVSQMITYNTLKGRGALKEVLRVYNNMSFEEMNAITKHIPDEAKIADELQDTKDEDGSASIIRWTLENNADKLKDWCFIDSNNQLSGPLAKRFEQAIRIEGTKYNQSKHAAGVAIAATDLKHICPMIYDNKTDQSIAGLEMNDLESLGVIKFDVLGIALLDKLMSVNMFTKKRRSL